MNKVYLLGSRQTIDKSVQVVEVNQVIRMEGYNYDKYVVYDITRDSWGVHYHLINLRTLNFDISEIIRPLSQKFGIGIYYDENNIEFNNGHIATDPKLASMNFLNALDKIPNLMEKYQSENTKLEKDLPIYKEIMGKTFTKEPELKDLKSQLDSLSRQINLTLASKEELVQETKIVEPAPKPKVAPTQSISNVRSGEPMSIREIIDSNRDRVLIGKVDNAEIKKSEENTHSNNPKIHRGFKM